MAKYAIGLDYGTLSVRALLLNAESGEEIGVSVFEYPHGVMETELPTGEKLPVRWALQHPEDYRNGFVYTIKDVVQKCGVMPEEIIGIGVDFTACTVMPVDKEGCPLCCTQEFQREPHAYVKLWKHHGGEDEALYIDRIARERGESWLGMYGGKISSEWLFPKILEILHQAPDVYQRADSFVEALDWIIWQLTGEHTISACTLGYKAFYHHETGFVSGEFLKALDPALEHFAEEKMAAPIKNIGETAGYLTEEMADILGLIPGIPVGSGIIDAHSSVLGGGIAKPGEMMIVMGTSSCHLLLAEKEARVPGICGIVKDGIIPGYFGAEAGQSCVGDQFAWFTNHCVPESYEKEAREKKISIHQLLSHKLSGYKAGQSGLIALDWFNGVRSPLMDFNLNGMIMGMNLLTKPEEIYLALIESTAYGTRLIVEQFEQAGVDIASLLLGGGIPMKNPMLVQVYADILNRPIRIAGTSQACATGAAILGIAAADKEVSGYGSVCEIVEKIGKQLELVYYPDKDNAEVYDKLYAEYKTLLEYFGKGGNDVMKRLNKIREEQKR